MADPPMLILELVGPILSHAIRLVRPRHLDQSQHLAQILNVVPRSYMPTVTDTAIMVMPWIDTEFACKLGDLWLLDTLHDRLARSPMCRPLHFAANRALRMAADAGNVHVLDWWLARFAKLDYTSDNAILMSSSRSGNLNVLQWWMRVPRANKMYRAGWAIEMATKSGHIDILECFRANGFTFSYLYYEPQDVVLNQHVHVVKWWIEHDLLAKFPKQMLKYAMVAALIQGDRQTLDVLLATPDIQTRFKDSEIAHIASFACATGDLEFINHCHRLCPGGGIPEPIGYIVASAFGDGGHLHVLDWLVKRNAPYAHVKLTYPDWRLLDERMVKQVDLSMMRRIALEFSPFFFAIAKGHLAVLDWLQAHSFAPSLQGDKYALQFASAPTLDWIQTHQPDLLAVADVDVCLQHASKVGDVGVLDWWARQVGLDSKMTRPVSLREAPVAVWEWWVKSGLPFHFHEPGDRARRFDSPPPLNVCEWLLRNGQLPMWKLPEWITKVGYSAQDDSFLSWLDAHDLIQPLLETMQEQHWPMHTNDSSSLTWTSLLWWMDKVGPRFKDLLQQIPLSFTNTLMLDYIWKACGKGNSISLDGDRLSLWNGHRALEWGLAAGVSIHHKFAFKNATSGAQDNSCLETLEWWCKNRVLIQPAIPKARSVAKLCRGNEEVWAWWERSGLLSDIADVANELDDIFMTEEPSEDSELDD